MASGMGADPVRSFMRLSYDGWREFFKVDLLRVASYAARIRRLVELLKLRSGTLAAVKIVMGVIGRDTIGYSRDIQECFSSFLGVECLRCREAIAKVSAGVPFEQVASSVALRFGEVEFLKLVRVLEGLVRDGVKAAIGVDIDEDYLNTVVEKDFNTLSGNPLRLFKLLGGLLTTLRRVLPHYNPYTFFVYSLRNTPRFAVEKFLGVANIEVAGRFGIAIENLIPSKDGAYSIISHKPGSVGDTLASATDLMFRIHEVGIVLNHRRLRVRDERRDYIEVFTPLVKDVASTLGVEGHMRMVTAILLSSAQREKHGTYITVRTKVRTENPALNASIGGRRIAVDRLMSGLAPYLLLGLGRFENIVKREADIVADLVVYLPYRSSV